MFFANQGYHLAIIVLTEVDVASSYSRQTSKQILDTNAHSHGCKIVGSCLKFAQFSTMTAGAMLRVSPFCSPNTHLHPAPSCNSLLHLQPSSAKLLCLLRRHLQLPLAYLITRVWRSLNLKPLQPLESNVLHLHYSWRARAQPIPRLATFYGGELQFLIILCGTFEWQLCCHLIYRRLFIRASQGKELITFLTFLEHIAKDIGLS